LSSSNRKGEKERKMTKIFGIAKENRDDLLLDFSWRAPSVSIHDAWF